MDRDSFIAFARALAAERETAKQMEHDEPVRYMLGGAMDWQNGDIASFLYASLNYFEPSQFRQPEVVPSWKMMAELL